MVAVLGHLQGVVVVDEAAEGVAQGELDEARGAVGGVEARARAGAVDEGRDGDPVVPALARGVHEGADLRGGPRLGMVPFFREERRRLGHGLGVRPTRRVRDLRIHEAPGVHEVEEPDRRARVQAESLPTERCGHECLRSAVGLRDHPVARFQIVIRRLAGVADEPLGTACPLERRHPLRVEHVPPQLLGRQRTRAVRVQLRRRRRLCAWLLWLLLWS
mmetsp:Transcript_12315/g.37192  ORF Transcript_12315/g.37192 Transcript_12315/m.37192 type:complete len:218 (-) Transcript_12315:236-889(-)